MQYRRMTLIVERKGGVNMKFGINVMLFQDKFFYGRDKLEYSFTEFLKYIVQRLLSISLCIINVYFS